MDLARMKISWQKQKNTNQCNLLDDDWEKSHRPKTIHFSAGILLKDCLSCFWFVFCVKDFGYFLKLCDVTSPRKRGQGKFFFSVLSLQPELVTRQMHAKAFKIPLTIIFNNFWFCLLKLSVKVTAMSVKYLLRFLLYFLFVSLFLIYLYLFCLCFMSRVFMSVL